jgi:RNA polymerase subunit RPABC4/transcription elongation factor Spt4
MITKIRNILYQFFSKSRTINNEPLNKVSLIIIILIDIFILVNVFSGLDDISGWHISPRQVYPCYYDWKEYRKQTQQDQDYNIIITSFPEQIQNASTFRQLFQQVEEKHLGTVSEICLRYADHKDKINNPVNQEIVDIVNQKQEEIQTLEQANVNIRNQYDSALLEKIAGQPREQSINLVGAEKAKQELEQNNRQISTLKREISRLKNDLVSKPESISFLALVNDDEQFAKVEKGYQKASFWYPSIQLVFQTIFLLPLIFATLSIHRLAQRKGYGLISLMSWHLLVIFLLPLIFKIFEFLQIGIIAKFIFDIISILFGGLVFLISYVYILLIPLVGFGVIKLFQKLVFNKKNQAASRIQNSLCINCTKKIRPQDNYCPHCGYYQYVECKNCHQLTYKHLPYCKQCGSSQAANHL